MSIEQAIDILRKKYEEAQTAKHINNPLAYALYHTWREVDGVKPPVDLVGKCGSCTYAKSTTAFGGSKCYVECTHPDRRYRSGTSHLKQRTTRACKKYRQGVVEL